MIRKRTENFSVPIKKELENGKKTTWKIDFIESFKIFLSSIWSLVDNFEEGLCNSKCKNCKSCLEYIKAKDKLLLFQCSKCNKDCKKF